MKVKILTEKTATEISIALAEFYANNVFVFVSSTYFYDRISESHKAVICYYE